MNDFAIGARVRIYYDQDTFDEGEITVVSEDHIDVDFYDWVERWCMREQFKTEYIWLEGKQVLVAVTRGEIVTAYRTS